jgi:signal recognition particle receptor subunit alpha
VTSTFAGGFILWSRSFTPAAEALATSNASPVNSLIREALIEGREDQEKYEKDGYTVRWSFINDLELIFVVRGVSLTSLSFTAGDEKYRHMYLCIVYSILGTAVTNMHPRSLVTDPSQRTLIFESERLHRDIGTREGLSLLTL